MRFYFLTFVSIQNLESTVPDFIKRTNEILLRRSLGRHMLIHMQEYSTCMLTSRAKVKVIERNRELKLDTETE